MRPGWKDVSSSTAPTCALGRSSCPIAKTARIAAYMASQSAGQCGPCVFGLGALAGVLERLAAGHGGRDDAARLARWTDMVRGRGCSFTTAVSDAQALIARHSEGPVELNQANDTRYTPWQPQPKPVGLSTHLRPGALICRT